MDDPESIVKGIGRRIAEVRRQAGWSQKEFAEILNSSVQWVSLLECGKQNLTVHTLVRLANKLGVPTIALLRSAGPELEGKRRGRPRS